MSYSCCTGNFSSSSLGDSLRCPGSACGSSCPSNLVYSTDLCSPGTCPPGSSLHRGCQETCWELTSCQTSCVVSSSCQPSCYRPRTSTLCSPFQKTYSGSLGCGSSSCYSLACGSNGFRPLSCGVRGFPFLSHGSRFWGPSYLNSRTVQSSCYRPTCGSNFY